MDFFLYYAPFSCFDFLRDTSLNNHIFILLFSGFPSIFCGEYPKRFPAAFFVIW
jgi:hypothetical protein